VTELYEVFVGEFRYAMLVGSIIAGLAASWLLMRWGLASGGVHGARSHRGFNR